LKLIFEMF